MENAKDALRAALQAHAPYSDLRCDKQRRARAECLRQFADVISMGCGRQLLRDACGPDNETARKIVSRVELVRNANATGTTMSKSCREYVVNALSLLVPGVSRQWLRDAGCAVGKDLYATVKSFAASSTLVFESTQSATLGRPEKFSASRIRDAWSVETRDTGRVKADGSSLLTYAGGKRRALCAVMQSASCTRWAALKHRPENITRAKKKTDLCPLCEALRVVRRELVAAACAQGASIKPPHAEAGHRDYAGPGDEAAAFLANSGCPDVDVLERINRLPVLKWHEGEVAQSIARYHGARRKGVTVTLDFASRLELRSARGDSREWRRPHVVGHFGMALTRPSGDKYDTFFFDVFFFGLQQSSNVASVCIEEAVRHAKAAGLLLDADSEVAIFSDRGKHFASGEFVCAALLHAFSGMARVTMNYFASYHGKNPLDAHFGQVKQQVGAEFVEKWPLDKAMVQGRVVEAAERVSGTRATFLIGNKHAWRERRALKLQWISSVRTLEVVTAPEGGPQLYVDGALTPIQEDVVARKSAQDDDNGWSGGGRGCEVDVGALCNQLIRHQKRLRSLCDAPGPQKRPKATA